MVLEAFMGHKHSYIYTNKQHPNSSIMSTVLGTLSLTAIVVSIYLTYLQKGEARIQYGAAMLLALVFSFIGVWLAFIALRKRDIYYIFPILGMVFNVLAIVLISLILFAGAYGI
jgi:hypothetical protein